jgi:ankyrin repeat protein
MKRLLAAGATVNDKDSFSTMPLYYAAAHGRGEVVRFLLDNGADIEARRKDGLTALMTAAYSGHQEIVELLIERGANINARDNAGLTVLDCAAMSGSEPLMALLRQHGDVTAPKAAEPERTTCKRCGAGILTATASRHGGLCAICAKRHR